MIPLACVGSNPISCISMRRLLVIAIGLTLTGCCPLKPLRLPELPGWHDLFVQADVRPADDRTIYTPPALRYEVAP